MRNTQASISSYLIDVLEERKRRNPKYSQRAFARDLKLSPGRLSDILTGRRLPGSELTARIAEALDLSLDESKAIINLVKKQRFLSTSGAVSQLNEDDFSLIADWEHYAILMLMGTSDFQSNLSWVSERLQISELRVQNSLERLERLKLIQLKKSSWIRLKNQITTTHDIPSAVLRESHRQNLEQALDSLSKHSVEVRDITSITLPTNPQKIPEAKKLIRDFRRKMTKLLTEDERTEVYNLNIQLVPVTNVRQK